MKRGIVLASLVFVLVIMLMPYESHAVPSYARQVKKPCTACHTMWPNLNQYGRQFKVKAYTDVSPDWEMITKDNMNLATISPLSARVLFYPNIREDNNNPNGPAGTNSGSTNPGQNSTNFDQVAIFFASRVFDYAGVFTSAEADADGTTNATFSVPTLKMAFQYPLGEGNTIGLVEFKGVASAADPFNSFGGRDRDVSFQAESAPFILSSGWTFAMADGDNVGTVLHGYFIGNRLYAAIGAMRGGTVNFSGPGATSANTASQDPYDTYLRAGWDQKLSNGAVTFGAVMYDGKQRITNSPGAVTTYDSKVRRGYIDASLEQNFGEDHLFEVQALLGNGKESNVFGGSEERKFKGSYIQGSYFYDRKYGVVASINKIKFQDAQATDFTTIGGTNFGADKINSWLLAVDYLPWLNTKAALQYVNTKTTYVSGVSADTTDKMTRIVIDMLF